MEKLSKFNTPSLVLDIGKKSASKLIGKQVMGGLNFPLFTSIKEKYVGPVLFTDSAETYETSVFFIKSLLLKNGKVFYFEILTVRSETSVFLQRNSYV